MEKEEKVTVLLLFMTLTSLMTAYLCFGSELTALGQETGKEVRQYTRESVEGEKVFLEAEVLSKRFTYTGGHLLLQIDCDSEVLSVFIPKTAGADALNLSIQEGDFISLTGTVEEYEGKREIKVDKKENIYLNNPRLSE
ncbi:OB-fold nucleic acid binding domain-containing protein [Methanosarcina sp. UBA411]|jgi:DNA/RNA endonuclease YhcR with UshA esterase domain|uniref:OB-fold nucleic acid binding domain-containing protein n=1 Tax=Methanosarcina sp. UBA411 TaxID=1915589 RepID=UPI0025DF3B61|nr:OB-fold nucleic acid binding domain-containing protein [Methanosarcina sp. UBA411]